MEGLVGDVAARGNGVSHPVRVVVGDGHVALVLFGQGCEAGTGVIEAIGYDEVFGEERRCLILLLGVSKSTIPSLMRWDVHHSFHCAVTQPACHAVHIDPLLG